ncbi:beta-glucosidase [Paremcibacter congregatus]|uniref:Beta-glucosidase n=2 Tax=Paremcibacter congregatus TaxID=2043170 RepID=A0A2G4YVE0_9PROT|nr:beta-glucosidase [Paremcibacter congregatus]QDE29271.1 glycoside hydrolase family 3 protein [Paremcibacter congregatus]
MFSALEKTLLASTILLAGLGTSAPTSLALAQDAAPTAYLGAEQWPQVASPVKKDQAVEQKIKALLAQMSLEEKVGQILQPEIQFITPEEIKTYHIGSILNGGGSLPNRNKHAHPSEWLAMADAYYDASVDTTDGKIAIPIIWGSDAVHGHNNVIGATLFPHNIGLGAARNPGLLRKIGAVTAREIRVTGIDWTFAPTLAVVQNDRWGRTYESYSEKPEVVRSYAGEMVLGLQGVPGTAEFLDVNHVVATAKHFVGDGGTLRGDDQGDARISEAELRDIHAQGYITALEAGAQTAMASFSSWQGKKMHGNKYLLTDVLKNRMGLDGLVVGDWNGHGQVPGCTNASCAAAINAGVDLLMVTEDWREMYHNTITQVKKGEVALTRLDDAVSRILRVKIRAGLFEKGRPSSRGVAGQDGIIGSPEHRAVARQAVRESLVLLKNNDNLLPLKPGQTILVAGDAADNIGKQSGGWTISWQGTGNVNSDFPGGTSLYQGIKQAAEAAGSTALYSLDGSYAEKPDVAVVIFGEEPYAESQGDRDSLEFEAGNKKSLALLKKMKAADIPVVSVFLSGRPMWVNPELNASDAFVAAWLPGSEGGGLADVLVADKTGEVRYDFKGRLSFSWPKGPLQDVLNPHHDSYDPLFAYGYGLNYQSGAQPLAALPEDVEGVHKGQGETVVLFSGRPPAPWQMFIDDHTTAQIISGPYAAMPSGAVIAQTTDKDVQEDALKVVLTGAKPGGVFIGGGEPLDFSHFLQEEGILAFDLKINQTLGKDLSVQLSCGEGCLRAVSVTDHVRGFAGQGWMHVAIKLTCFAQAEDRFDSITMPFRLESTGAADLSFANVKLSKGGYANLQCP